jgi:hypothetical protein
MDNLPADDLLILTIVTMPIATSSMHIRDELIYLCNSCWLFGTTSSELIGLISYLSIVLAHCGIMDIHHVEHPIVGHIAVNF